MLQSLGSQRIARDSMTELTDRMSILMHVSLNSRPILVTALHSGEGCGPCSLGPKLCPTKPCDVDTFLNFFISNLVYLKRVKNSA